MGYMAYMKELLRPLGIYELGTGFGAAELQVEGAALDLCDGELTQLQQEIVLQTAEDYGLTNYESLLPDCPVYPDLAARRQGLMQLLRMPQSSPTLAGINQSLQACSIPAMATELEQVGYVQIHFPGYTGMPENMEQLKTQVEKILPCHLEIVYVYTYATWSVLEAAFAT